MVKPWILPKNKRMNSFLLLCDVFWFVFWKKLKTPKRQFEIIGPVPGEKLRSFGIYFILVWFKNNFIWVFRRKTRWMNMISYMLYNMNFIAWDYSFDSGLANPTFLLGILLTSPIVLGPMFAIHKTCLIKNLRIAMVICSELCHFKLIWKTDLNLNVVKRVL